MSRVLPATTFDQLCTVMQEMVEVVEGQVTTLAETDIFPPNLLNQQRIRRFFLVVSPLFSGLLIGRWADDRAASAAKVSGELDSTLPNAFCYQVELEFDTAAIAGFLEALQPTSAKDSHPNRRLLAAQQQLRPNTGKLQGEFVLRLTEVLSTTSGDRPFRRESSLDGRASESAAKAQTLEQQIIDRTQALHDALNAAQSASLAKTEFLAVVSHELRTPLAAIIGMSTTLLRRFSDGNGDYLLSPEKQQNYLNIIRASGEHLLNLINDILDLSQVEAGRAILDIQPFFPGQLATECFRLVRDKAEQRDIKLTLETGGSVTTDNRCSADPRRVKQILLNLLNNAIKFTPEGGSVALRVWTSKNATFFQVEDTGIGIPQQKFPLLFKKFQQLDQSYHRQYEGTGLGLALTKQFVDLHGGRIDVESVVDVGSIFTVQIPVQSPIGDRPKPIPDSLLDSVQPRTGRVVLIENREQTATLMCDLLTAAGHQVIWIVDGFTGMIQIELLQPDVVMINTEMPAMNAINVLQQLRHNPKIRDLSLLLLTTDMQPMAGTCDLPQPEGVDSLALPLTHPEDLLDKIAALMARNRRNGR